MRKLIYLIVFCLPLYLIRFGSFNFLEILVYVSFIIWLFSKKKIILPNKWLQYGILLLFSGLTISTVFSVDLRISAGIWKGWFIMPLLFFILAINVIKEEEIKNILISLTLSGVAVSLIALGYRVFGLLTYDGRLSAFYLSPNHLAMYLSPILILSFYLKKNIFRTVAQCLMFLVIYLTYSYGALLGIFAALFLVIKKKKLILLLILIVLLLQLPTQKFQGYLDLDYPALQSRLVIWQSAARITKDHLLVGIGPGMFQKYYLDYQVFFPPYPEWAVPQPHNIFLAFWLQTGLLGLVGFIWLLVVFFKKNLFAAAMVCILVHGLVDTTYWKNDLAMIFWLIIALSCIAGHLFYLQKSNNLH